MAFLCEWEIRERHDCGHCDDDLQLRREKDSEIKMKKYLLAKIFSIINQIDANKSYVCVHSHYSSSNNGRARFITLSSLRKKNKFDEELHHKSESISELNA